MRGAPDVYEGAPLPVLAFFVIVPKIAYLDFLIEGLRFKSFRIFNGASLL